MNAEQQQIRTIETLLGLIYSGRPGDPRDCPKWTRETVRAERVLLSYQQRNRHKLERSLT